MKKFKKINYAIVIIVMVVLIAAKAATSHADFSGKWMLDVNKTDFHNNIHKLAYKMIIIIQTRDSISIENFLTGKNGIDSSSLERFGFKGGISKKILPDTSLGVDTRYRSIAPSMDGQSLILIENNEFAKRGKIKKTNVVSAWKLLAMGNELQIKKTFTFPDSSVVSIEAVYNKQ